MKLTECSIAGFIFASICIKSITSISCPYNSDTETASCQGKGLNKVPTDLPRSTKKLDISGNPLNLTAESFENLTSLTTLIMQRIDFRAKFADAGALLPLEKLEYVDLTGSKFDQDFNFIWPKTNAVETLIIDQTSFDSLNLQELNNLKKLSAKNCSMEFFPGCSMYAPLKCVDLTDNPLSRLTVLRISYYCLLEKLFVKYPATGSDLKSQQRRCQCLALEQWADRYNLEGGLKKLDCYKDGADCNIDFTAEIKNMDECTKRVNKITPWKEMFLGALLALAVFLLLYVIYRKCIAPFLPSEENKPSTTPRPRRPTPKLPKPWPSLRLRFFQTPPPELPGEEEEEEEEEEED